MSGVIPKKNHLKNGQKRTGDKKQKPSLFNSSVGSEDVVSKSNTVKRPVTLFCNLSKGKQKDMYAILPIHHIVH